MSDIDRELMRALKEAQQEVVNRTCGCGNPAAVCFDCRDGDVGPLKQKVEQLQRVDWEAHYAQLKKAVWNSSNLPRGSGGCWCKLYGTPPYSGMNHTVLCLDIRAALRQALTQHEASRR